MHIRLATADDRVAIRDCHIASVQAFGRDGYDAEQVRHWAMAEERSPEDYDVESEDEHYTVAIRNGSVCGFGHLVPDEGEIQAVYVHPDHARQGVGSALLAEMEGYARGCGLPTLLLYSSLNAVGFYERAEYQRMGIEESPGGLPVVEMRKPLGR